MLVTLLTDFGTADYFVGAMKGALLSVNPQARIVDITHDIPPHDIRAGAWTLLAAYGAFPPGTIHVAVVDPGVGSARRPLLIEAGAYRFIGPDNGLFSYICEREATVRAFHLTNDRFFRQPVSQTFHGRDIFAPVAGALTIGAKPESLGAAVADFVRLEPIAPRPADGRVEASIIHIDRFGNCITSITPQYLSDEAIARGARLIVKEREIRAFKRYFAEPSTAGEELFAVWGSAGFLEIAVFRGSAARLLGAERGDRVDLVG
jgi:S-adenosylmethionine hydrolase